MQKGRRKRSQAMAAAPQHPMKVPMPVLPSVSQACVKLVIVSAFAPVMPLAIMPKDRPEYRVKTVIAAMVGNSIRRRRPKYSASSHITPATGIRITAPNAPTLPPVTIDQKRGPKNRPVIAVRPIARITMPIVMKMSLKLLRKRRFSVCSGMPLVTGSARVARKASSRLA